MASTAVRLDMARESLRFRNLRASYFPQELFAEFAWTTLLHAYICHVDGRPVRCGETIPSTQLAVARRWCRVLEEEELLVTEKAAGDELSTLTPRGVTAMEEYLDELADAVLRRTSAAPEE